MAPKALSSTSPSSLPNYYDYNDAVKNNPLNKLAEPIVDSFVAFTNKIENPEGSLGKRILVAGARQFELIGGLVRIGNTIEADRQKGDATYGDAKYEIARYASAQTAGVALGGLGLVVGGIVLGPLGIATGVLGYLAGSAAGRGAFNYLISKID